MFARFAAALALAALTALAPVQQIPTEPPRPAAPQAAATTTSPRIASYSIDARLDPATRTMAGQQILTWRNATSSPTATLRFHLYYNAWRNTNSPWMREQRLTGNPAGVGWPESDWSWIDIDRLRVTRSATETDFTDRIQFLAPDDGNTDDRTVAEVALDRPVAPGETITVRMEWASHVPRTFARTGVIGDYYFIAQWFPKVGVLENARWNCHQFHATTEFFSDFGTYDVRLTVPREWIVEPTGQERSRQDQADGTTTHHYYQDEVHDFFDYAWLDEGLNTFSTSRVLAEVSEPNYVLRRYFGGSIPWVLRDLPIVRETRSLTADRGAAQADAQSMPSWRYSPRTAGATTYHKTALWLQTLELKWSLVWLISQDQFLTHGFMP